jgi:DNA-binding NarL/FixJ family response regulator
MKIVIVGNQPLFRLGVIDSLKKIDPTLKCQEYSSIESIAPLIDSDSLLCVFENLDKRSLQFDCLTKIKIIHPKLNIVWITELFGSFESLYLKNNIINYCLPKRISCEDALIFFHSVLNSKSCALPKKAIHSFNHNALYTYDFNDLTSKQLQILICVSKGAFNKQIANSMCLSLATIKAQLTDIYNKLGVQNRLQAALVYRGIKLVVR